jgi:hypothetical protein
VLFRSLPKKLAGARSGIAWADAAWRRTLKAYEDTRSRYAELGEEMPSLTRRAMSEKLDALEGIAAPAGDWKTRAEGHFAEIRAGHRDAMHAFAMLPLQITKLENRLADYRRRVGLGQSGRKLTNRIVKEEGKLAGYEKKLDFLRRISKPSAPGTHHMIITGGRAYKGPELLEDAARIRKHLESAKQQLDSLKRFARRSY